MANPFDVGGPLGGSSLAGDERPRKTRRRAQRGDVIQDLERSLDRLGEVKLPSRRERAQAQAERKRGRLAQIKAKQSERAAVAGARLERIRLEQEIRREKAALRAQRKIDRELKRRDREARAARLREPIDRFLERREKQREARRVDEDARQLRATRAREDVRESYEPPPRPAVVRPSPPPRAESASSVVETR